MLNLLLQPFIALSAIGLFLSIIIHLIALSGGQVPFGNYALGLHVGIEGHSLSTLRRVAKVLHAKVRVTFEPEKRPAGCARCRGSYSLSCTANSENCVEKETQQKS